MIGTNTEESNTDPMGRAILDHVQGDVEATEVWVNSNLTENETIPLELLFRNWDQMPEKEKFALSLSRGRILDVGAGSGGHALALQEMKRDVTALDQSANSCKAMAKRGVLKIVQADFYEYQSEEKYDTLLLMMNGFGIAGTMKNLRPFLLHCQSLLKPGGLLIGESSDILYMYEDEDGSIALDLNGDYYGEVNYQMRYKNHTSEWFPWLYISSDLLTEAAEEVGFTEIDYFEGESDDYMICFRNKDE
jgi:SAM-dependent methyltransferase